MMTGCDLVASAKPWNIQTETVKVIFEEFYDQGDAERQNGKDPIAMMDRHQAHQLPQMQVERLEGRFSSISNESFVLNTRGSGA